MHAFWKMHELVHGTRKNNNQAQRIFHNDLVLALEQKNVSIYDEAMLEKVCLESARREVEKRNKLLE